MSFLDRGGGLAVRELTRGGAQRDELALEGHPHDGRERVGEEAREERRLAVLLYMAEDIVMERGRYGVGLDVPAADQGVGFAVGK
jgi:hypothetical protein